MGPMEGDDHKEVEVPKSWRSVLSGELRLMPNFYQLWPLVGHCIQAVLAGNGVWGPEICGFEGRKNWKVWDWAL